MTKKQSDNADPWELSLKRLLPLWGHRNWIVVADSAYPAQSNPGIETIATDADHLQVLKAALDAIDNSTHSTQQPTAAMRMLLDTFIRDNLAVAL